MSVDIQLQADVEAKAKQFYAVARRAFCYAPAGTPDGGLFDRSIDGQLLMNAMRLVAADLLGSSS